MASPSNSSHDAPSLSTSIQQSFPRDIRPSPDEEERLDLLRMKADTLQLHASLARGTGATEPASAYHNVLLTEKQINYLLVILKPYLSPIAEECRVKLESA